MAKVSYDHDGVRYPSFKAMCEHYGIAAPTVKNRLLNGYSMKQALTEETRVKAVTDPEGNHFRSISEMCRHWNICSETYRARIGSGLTQAEALSSRAYSPRVKPVTDHLGNTYWNVTEMCRHYGINRSTYMARIRKGCSVEQALTSNRVHYADSKKPGNVFTDGVGKYDTLADLAKAHNLKPCTLYQRLRRGITLKNALAAPGMINEFTDHKGTVYGSFSSMCKAWHQDPNLVKVRLNKGKSLKDALEPQRDIPYNAKSCTDGVNEYPSLTAMAKAYGVSRRTLSLNAEIDDEGMIHVDTSQFGSRDIPCTDHLGNDYPSISAMCRAYNVCYYTMIQRLKRGFSLEEALTGKRKEAK